MNPDYKREVREMSNFTAGDLLHAVVFFALWIAISGIVTIALSYAAQSFPPPIASGLGYMELLVWGVVLALLVLAFNGTAWNWWDSIV